MSRLEEKLVELGYYRNPKYNNVFYKRINNDYFERGKIKHLECFFASFIYEINIKYWKKIKI